MSYLFTEIICNQRSVSIEDILQSKVKAQSTFEQSLFGFIREWISEKNEFTLHTSGSTGKPKDITLTRNQLQQSSHRTIEALSLKKNQTAFICLDPKYIAGKMMVVRALEAHMKMLAVEPSANPLLSIDSPIDFIAIVPLQLQEIMNHPASRKKLNHCRTVIVGGASINSSSRNEIKNLECNVFATYGMTETVSHIALQPLNGKTQDDYFTTLPGITIQKDEKECLIISMREFNQPIITNDLVEILSPNTFRILGRFDNVINSGGHKISPEKVEQIVEQAFDSLDIRQSFFAAGVEDLRLGQKLVLCIEGSALSGNLEESLFDSFKHGLSPYEIPKEIRYINQFLRTETGKIKRSETLWLPG